MTTTSTPEPVLKRVFSTLRRLRYVVYGGGLAVVVLSSVGLPAWTRTPLVVGVLTVMGTTYLAELSDRAAAIRPRAVVTAVAVGGIAIGAFVLVELDRLSGLLFLLGGVLFFRATITDQDEGGDVDEDTDD